MTFDSNTDLRATFPRFTPEARIANQAVVDLLRACLKIVISSRKREIFVLEACRI
jgi:hypothetical protein